MAVVLVLVALTILAALVIAFWLGQSHAILPCRRPGEEQR
jgi:hypothetical protein